MNLLLLEGPGPRFALPRSDRRVEHITRILRKGPGDRVAAGRAGAPPGGPAPGALGEALILEAGPAGLLLEYEPAPGAAGEPPPLHPLLLVLGMPRPIQANRVLKDLTSLGFSRILLARTELGEKSYMESDFFKNREWGGALLEGAEQAANPRLPLVEAHWSLERALEALEATEGAGARPAPASRYALHPYGAEAALGDIALAGAPACLAVGSERGWTEGEVALLRERGFVLVSLGSRILKTETAALAAGAVLLAKLGLM